MHSPADILLVLLLGIPFAAGVGILASHVWKGIFKSALKQTPLEAPDRELEIERLHAKERAEARELYERVVREKLDVINTALAMGYDRLDIKQLDARLEHLIGIEQLQSLLKEPNTPLQPVSSELLDKDLTREINELKRSEQQRE